MILAEGITKTIGSKKILKGIDLNIHSGEFVTCFGPNGAGKSTTLNILALLSSATSGKLLINGQDAREHSRELKKKIGVISHKSFLYNNLTAYENLKFYGKMYEVDNLDPKVHDLLNRVGLTYVTNDPISSFSRGMQQRLSIARSLIHDPSILLMDEPYTGLDEMAKSLLSSILKELSLQKRTIFLITHDFDQGLELSHQVLILVRGRIDKQLDPKGMSRDLLREEYLKCVGGGK